MLDQSEARWRCRRHRDESGAGVTVVDHQSGRRHEKHRTDFLHRGFGRVSTTYANHVICHRRDECQMVIIWAIRAAKVQALASWRLRFSGRPLLRPGRASSVLSSAETGMVRCAAFDLPGEPGPSLRPTPEPSTWAHRTTLKQPAQHARGLPGACFPRLQTMGARPYLSAGYRVGDRSMFSSGALMADGCYVNLLDFYSLLNHTAFFSTRNLPGRGGSRFFT